MSNKILGTPQYLDGKKIFEQWSRLGGASFAKMVRWCADNGMKHPDTGKNPTRMGVWFTMWSWALDNPKEAKPLFDSVVKQRGKFYSEKDWLELLYSRARVIYKNGNQYRRFMKEHPIT